MNSLYVVLYVVPILYVCNVFKETNLKTVEAYMEVPALLFLDWGVKLPLETRALEDLTVFPKVLDMFYFCLPLLLDFLQIVLIGNLSCELVHFMNFFKIPNMYSLFYPPTIDCLAINGFFLHVVPTYK